MKIKTNKLCKKVLVKLQLKIVKNIANKVKKINKKSLYQRFHKVKIYQKHKENQSKLVNKINCIIMIVMKKKMIKIFNQRIPPILCHPNQKLIKLKKSTIASNNAIIYLVNWPQS
jgi:DNA polymerase elongation subunit (family B)